MCTVISGLLLLLWQAGFHSVPCVLCTAPFLGSSWEVNVSLSLQSKLSNYLVLRTMSHVGMWWSSTLLCSVSLTSISACLCYWWYFLRHPREDALHLDSPLALTHMNATAGHSEWLTEQRVLGYDPLQNTTSGHWACLFSYSLESCQSSDMLWSYSPFYWQWKTTLGWGFSLLKL